MANTITSCGINGRSAKGNFLVQTRAGGGYMVLRRLDPYAGWVRVVETAYYVEACIAIDVLVAEHGDTCVEEEAKS